MKRVELANVRDLVRAQDLYDVELRLMLRTLKRRGVWLNVMIAKLERELSAT